MHQLFNVVIVYARYPGQIRVSAVMNVVSGITSRVVI